MNKEKGAFAVALVLVVVYVCMVAAMMFATGVEETIWSRRVFLLTGFESIVFAGAGFLFGKEVHRKEAENAKADADEAKQQAKAQAGKADAERDKAEGALKAEATARSQAAEVSAKGQALTAQINAAAAQAGLSTQSASKEINEAPEMAPGSVTTRGGSGFAPPQAARTRSDSSPATDTSIATLAALRETANKLFPTQEM